MSEKAKKIITLIEGILILPALGLIMTDAIMDIIYFGMGPTLVTSILFIIMSGCSLLMAFSSFGFFKKENSKFLQSGYTYIFNSIGVALVIAGIMSSIYAPSSKVPLIYAFIALIIIYFVVFSFFEGRKILRPFAPFTMIILIVCFGIYVFLNPLIYNIFGFGLLSLCVILNMIKSFSKINHKNKDDSNSSSTNTLDNLDRPKDPLEIIASNVEDRD